MSWLAILALIAVGLVVVGLVIVLLPWITSEGR